MMLLHFNMRRLSQTLSSRGSMLMMLQVLWYAEVWYAVTKVVVC